MKLTDKFNVSPLVAARDVGQETVLLELASGTYFGLDPVGARMWRLMEEGRSLAEVCDAIDAEYEVSRELLERDALALAHELVEKNIISAT